MRDKLLQAQLEKVCLDPPEDFYRRIDGWLLAGEKRFVVTANPEIIMRACENEQMRALFEREGLAIVPDGIGVVLALKRLYGREDIQRNPGVELVSHLLAFGGSQGLSLFVYGARPEVLADFRRFCGERYPGLRFAGAYDGYHSDPEAVREALAASGADIVLAALGTPRQELFLDSVFDRAEKGVFVGIGGSLDVLSGHSKRAPQFFLDHNLEWLYRITREPKRMGRFISKNLPFLRKIYF